MIYNFFRFSQKREELLKDLSCAEEEEITSAPNLTSLSNTWPATTDAIFADQDTTTSEVTTENVTTEHEDDINQSSTMTSTSTANDLNLVTEYKSPIKLSNANKFNRVMLDNTLDMGLVHNNNLQSNYIPKIANGDNYLSNEELEKIEDDKHMQHKMLHEEIARLGNLENIFTQPTDHFVPPLVMAKAKISDDMTVLSLQEKHAQQLAEKHFSQQNNHIYRSNIIKSTTENPKTVSLDKERLMYTIKNKDDLKRDKIKSSMPKKYNEKIYDPKSKVQKLIESKSVPLEKTVAPFSTKSETSENLTTPFTFVGKPVDDSSLDLTVVLKDDPEIQEKKIYYANYTGDISKLEVIENSTLNNETEIKLVDVEATEETRHEIPLKKFEETTQNVTLNHEVKKITIISEGHTTFTPAVFDITTKEPMVEESAPKNLLTIINKDSDEEIHNNSKILSSTHMNTEKTQNDFEMEPVVNIVNDTVVSIYKNDTLLLVNADTTENIPTTTAEFPIVTTILANMNTSIQNNNINEATTTAISDSSHEMKTESYSEETHDEFGSNTNSSDIDDFQSPLLSGANEPVHRPNRSRRPQQPIRNKFNPFRILG